MNVYCKLIILYSGEKFIICFLTLGTPASSLTSTLITSFSCGMSQCQITVVSIVMVWCTKQTLSLKLSSIRINVRLWRLQSVEYCQVLLFLKNPFLFTVFNVYLDHPFAVIESEFNYKQCCNDEEGNFIKLN